jgi:hypothetical protein
MAVTEYDVFWELLVPSEISLGWILKFSMTVSFHFYVYSRHGRPDLEDEFYTIMHSHCVTAFEMLYL